VTSINCIVSGGWIGQSAQSPELVPEEEGEGEGEEEDN